MAAWGGFKASTVPDPVVVAPLGVELRLHMPEGPPATAWEG
jgi:hypothetical protein